MKIAVSEIKVIPGRRPANPDGVEKLAQSISEVGLLNPITVDQNHELIAGLHRLEAAKQLGWTEIECTVRDFDGLQSELAEIDENFVRTSLSTLEYGEMLERRKEIYESLHPETRAGQAQAAGMNRAVGNHVSDTMSVTSKSFARDTAEKLGKSPRTVERTIQMMKGLTQETRKVFHSNPKYELTQDKAMKLSKLSPGVQKTVAVLMVYNGLKRIENYPPACIELGGRPGSKDGKTPDEQTEIYDIVAGVKDPTKETAGFTPELFVLNYTADVRYFLRQVESSRSGFSADAAPLLTGEQVEEMQKATDSCCEVLREFIQWVRETSSA